MSAYEKRYKYWRDPTIKKSRQTIHRSKKAQQAELNPVIIEPNVCESPVIIQTDDITDVEPERDNNRDDADVESNRDDADDESNQDENESREAFSPKSVDGEEPRIDLAIIGTLLFVCNFLNIYIWLNKAFLGVEFLV